MQLASTAFLKAAKSKGSIVNPSQKLVAHTLADALAYRADRPVGAQIHYLVDYEVSMLRADNFHIFAHSLGGLIMADWLRSRAAVNIGSMNTFGCNIPLFSLGTTFDVPAAIGPKGRPWRNYYYDSDMLGYALTTVPELSHVRDIQLPDAGGLRWSQIVPGLSHIDYLGDRSFFERIPRDLGY